MDDTVWAPLNSIIQSEKTDKSNFRKTVTILFANRICTLRATKTKSGPPPRPAFVCTGCRTGNIFKAAAKQLTHGLAYLKLKGIQ
jgi:TPP-dependent indolepyruvate ferredoxin oxidoreductase alpha subunit